MPAAIQRVSGDLLALLLALPCAACRSEPPAAAEPAPAQPPAAEPTASIVAPPPTPPTPSISSPPPPATAPAADTAPAAEAPAATADTTAPSEPAIDLTHLQAALAGGDAEVVEIVERHPIGRDELVLYRWYGARAWRAQERAAGRLDQALAALEAKIEACERAEGIESVCLEGAIADPYLAWSTAGTEVFAWEVARVRDGKTVVARLRLFDLSLPVTDPPHKFKVYDIDGDQRSELTVIVPVDIPDHYEGMEEQTGEVGYILEAADLHLQFAATRRHDTSWQDVSGSETHIETVWLARDVNADRHPDLHLRETTRTRDNPGEDEPAAPRTRPVTRKTLCLYEPLPDLWRCPEALGQTLLPKPTPPG